MKRATSDQRRATRSAVVVAGTDTAVGKTVLTAGLIRWMNNEGLPTLGMKPFVCGASSNGKYPTFEDLEIIKKANSQTCLDEELSPLQWKSYLAPYRASRLEKKRVSFNKITQSIQSMRKKANLLLIEGIGGLLCPLTTQHTLADWVKQEKLPVLLVARLGLGTLNHTLMTLEVAKSRGIMVKGIILNDFPPTGRDVSRRWNPQDLKELTDVPIIGIFPFLKRATVEASKKAWEANFDFARIRKTLQG